MSTTDINKVEEWLGEHQKQDTENFKGIHTHLDRLDKATNNDLIVYKIDELNGRFDKLDNKLDSSYVTMQQFEPVRNIVYGMVGLILIGVIGAIVTTVIK